MHPLDHDELGQRAKNEHHASCHPQVECLDVGYIRQGGTREHRDEGEHARHEERHAPRDSVQAEPETEPRQLDDEGGRGKGLDEVVADLPLEAEVEGEARVVSLLLRANRLRLLEFEWRPQVVLQELQFRIERHSRLGPL